MINITCFHFHKVKFEVVLDAFSKSLKLMPRKKQTVKIDNSTTHTENGPGPLNNNGDIFNRRMKHGSSREIVAYRKQDAHMII